MNKHNFKLNDLVKMFDADNANTEAFRMMRGRIVVATDTFVRVSWFGPGSKGPETYLGTDMFDRSPETIVLVNE